MPLEMTPILFREARDEPIVNKCDRLVRRIGIFESPADDDTAPNFLKASAPFRLL